MTHAPSRVLVIVGTVVAVLGTATAGSAADRYLWNLPPGFPTPRVPADNPMSREKAVLGRFLFYDTRLSGNQTQSCASCHLQALAFTDGLPQGVGSTGEVHPRSSMSLTNVAYNATQTWANPLLLTLEQQALIPMFGEFPVELGLSGMEDELLRRLAADARYRRLFGEAFPAANPPAAVGTIVRGLASFIRTLISGTAPYDRWVQGVDESALSASAMRGGRLFFSEQLECFHCHGGFNFAASTAFEGKPFDEAPFHNNGLYNIDATGAYPPDNTGVHGITGKDADMGAFRAPTLRNIALTAPYMHDGSIATLDEVIDHYAAGGRTIADGPYAGVGHDNPHKSGFVRGFTLTPQDRQDLLTFLHSLTDVDFVTTPHLSNPFRPVACVGDCNYDATVTVNELVAAVGVGLSSATLATCFVADRSADGEVTIDELVTATGAALNGCPP
jgi:cytochrome c peroxidase